MSCSFSIQKCIRWIVLSAGITGPLPVAKQGAGFSFVSAVSHINERSRNEQEEKEETESRHLERC